MAKTYDPTMGRLLVEILSEEVSAGGIVLAKTSSDGDQRGKVIANGPDQRLLGGGVIEALWDPGQVVHFRKALKLDGALHIVEFADVLCVERNT